MTGETSLIGRRCAKIHEIKEQVRRITEKFNPLKIILFGSYAYGNPTPESDADLLIIMETDRSTLELSSEIAMSIDHYFPVDILVKTPEEIERRIQAGDFFVDDIMNHGKVLYERTGQRMD
jgi:predicted nucleotidyltransferase